MRDSRMIYHVSTPVARYLHVPARKPGSSPGAFPSPAPSTAPGTELPPLCTQRGSPRMAQSPRNLGLLSSLLIQRSPPPRAGDGLGVLGGPHEGDPRGVCTSYHRWPGQSSLGGAAGGRTDQPSKRATESPLPRATKRIPGIPRKKHLACNWADLAVGKTKHPSGSFPRAASLKASP